jgi:lysophospholipase L1-like esterase
MILTVLKLLSILLVLLGPTLLAGRRFGIARAFGALGVSLILSGCAGLMSPHVDSLYLKTCLGLSLLAWSAWIQFAPDSWSSFMNFLLGGSWRSGVFIALLSSVVPFGNLEWLALLTTNMGLIEAHAPMTTRLMHGVEDWRVDQVVSDTKREQDPVLFWRSRAGVPPFSSQGFKTSIEMAIPKPRDVYRIMAYGDSNTEGTDSLDWSQELLNILRARNTPERSYEVINAGVGGYSSYQGVQRFLQEWELYEPDLILVSFGWNDLPEALGQPDKGYKPDSKVMVNILRTLIQYRSYQAIQHYMVSGGLQQRKKEAQSRVPLDDYLDNMESFSAIGRTHGIEVVFLTRPYRATTTQIQKQSGWRSRVPSYNEALVKFAEQQDEQVIDVQKYFETETEGLFVDETHFSDEGMAEMARLLVRELDARGVLEADQGSKPAGAPR